MKNTTTTMPTAENPLRTMLTARFVAGIRADGTQYMSARAPQKKDFAAGCTPLFDAYKTALAGVAAAINRWVTTPTDASARKKAVAAMQAACDILRRAAGMESGELFDVKPCDADWLRAVSVADATSARTNLLGVARVKSDAALSRSLTTVACVLSQHGHLRIDVSKDEAKRRAAAAQAAENAKHAKNPEAEAAAKKAEKTAKDKARRAAKKAQKAAEAEAAAENAAA